MESSSHGCDLNLGHLYFRGAIESRISEQEELKREMRSSGLVVKLQKGAIFEFVTSTSVQVLTLTVAVEEGDEDC